MTFLLNAMGIGPRGDNWGGGVEEMVDPSAQGQTQHLIGGGN